MARFPRTEPEVIALSQAMVSGLTANAALYPAPPVLPAALTTLVSAYTTAKNTAIAAVAAAEAATASKDDALENLTDAMKSDIRYAENKGYSPCIHESKCLACGFTAGPLHHSRFDILNSPLPPLPLRPSSLVPHHSSLALRALVPSWQTIHLTSNHGYDIIPTKLTECNRISEKGWKNRTWPTKTTKTSLPTRPHVFLYTASFRPESRQRRYRAKESIQTPYYPNSPSSPNSRSLTACSAQNKPNSQKQEIPTTSCPTKIYASISPHAPKKNKANSNPIPLTARHTTSHIRHTKPNPILPPRNTRFAIRNTTQNLCRSPKNRYTRQRSCEAAMPPSRENQRRRPIGGRTCKEKGESKWLYALTERKSA